MKIALLTDTHFGARNDNLNFNEYFYDFYEGIFFPYLQQNNIKHCILRKFYCFILIFY